jgi:uncharacterized protein YlzI (FlbEa/FlbD family)
MNHIEIDIGGRKVSIFADHVVAVEAVSQTRCTVHLISGLKFDVNQERGMIVNAINIALKRS